MDEPVGPRAQVARLPDGGQLSYTILGRASAAPPVLLNRPLGGSMVLWGAFAERLARELQVIAFDPRGVGRSSDLRWRHSTRAMARDAVALLDVLGVTRTHVFGVSLGGMVASWIATDAPERVARLVLASTIPEASALSRRSLAKGLGFAQCFARRGAAAELCLVRQVVSSAFQAAHPRRMAEIERLVSATPARRANLVKLALAAARHRPAVPSAPLRPDTLLLFGAFDPLVGRTARAELLRDFPDATLEILPDAGHDLSLEQPLALAERVLAFLSAPDVA